MRKIHGWPQVVEGRWKFDFATPVADVGPDSQEALESTSHLKDLVQQHALPQPSEVGQRSEATARLDILKKSIPDRPQMDKSSRHR